MTDIIKSITTLQNVYNYCVNHRFKIDKALNLKKYGFSSQEINNILEDDHSSERASKKSHTIKSKKSYLLLCSHHRRLN